MHREFDIVDGNDPCPEMFVLQNYAVGRLSDLETRQAVQAHVPSCAICADIVRRLRGNVLPNEGIVNRLETRMKRRWEMRQRLTAQGPEPGTIWRTIPEATGQASGPLVLILSTPGPWPDEVLSVAEISREISQAIEDDIILERGDTDLPFRCMVRTSNRFPASRSFLDGCIGKLPEHWMQIVYQVCDPLQRFDNDTGFNEDEFVCDGYGNPLMRRRGVTSGVPVTDEQDPRLAFLRESMHKRRYLSREVKAAMLRREEDKEHALLPDTQTAAPAEPEPARRQHPPRLRLIGGGAEHRQRLRLPTTDEEESEDLIMPLAASEGHGIAAEEHPHAQLALVPIGTFEVESISYEASADAEGNVFLQPSPEPGKTHLVLDDIPYVLRRAGGDDGHCQVIGLGRGQLEFFFALRSIEEDQHRIGFKT